MTGQGSQLFGDCSVALLCRLRGGPQQLANLRPWDSRGTCRYHCIEDLAFAASTCQSGVFEKIFLDGSFVAFCGFLVLESFRQFVGVIEDLLNRSWHQRLLNNLGLASIAWIVKCTAVVTLRDPRVATKVVTLVSCSHAPGGGSAFLTVSQKVWQPGSGSVSVAMVASMMILSRVCLGSVEEPTLTGAPHPASRIVTARKAPRRIMLSSYLRVR